MRPAKTNSTEEVGAPSVVIGGSRPLTSPLNRANPEGGVTVRKARAILV